MQSDVTSSTQTTSQSVDEFVARLTAWSHGEHGMHAVWQAWVDGMRTQDRPVSAERSIWIGLAAREKKLDQFIADRVIAEAIKYATGGQNA